MGISPSATSLNVCWCPCWKVVESYIWPPQSLSKCPAPKTQRVALRVPSPENLICRTLIFSEQACQRGHATTHMPKSKRASHRPPCTGILNSNHTFSICLVYAKVASGGPRTADAAPRWEGAGGIIENAKGNLSWHWYYPKNYPDTKSPKPSATPTRSKTNIPKYHYPKRPRSMWVVNSARLMRSRCGAQHMQ